MLRDGRLNMKVADNPTPCTIAERFILLNIFTNPSTYKSISTDIRFTFKSSSNASKAKLFWYTQYNLNRINDDAKKLLSTPYESEGGGYNNMYHNAKETLERLHWLLTSPQTNLSKIHKRRYSW